MMRLGHSTILFTRDKPFGPRELELFAEFNYQDIELAEWHQPSLSILKGAEDIGLRIWSFHATAEDLSSPDREILARSRQQLIRCIEVTAELTHGRVLVFHGCGAFLDEAERSVRVRILVDTLQELIPIAAEHRVRLAMETSIPLPHAICDSAAEMIGILDAVGESDWLGIGLDVGHSACCEDPMTAYRLLAPRAITTHIHDGNYTHGKCPPDRGPDFMPGHEDRHLIPGDGGLDFVGLYRILEKAEYSGPWMYEVATLDPKQPIKQPRAVLTRIEEYHRQYMPQFVISADGDKGA